MPFPSVSYGKDFHCLLKTIDSFSDGQAKVVEWDDSDLSRFVVEISPSDGLYKGGKFKFSVHYYNDGIRTLPNMYCLTPIYHPNIEYDLEDEIDVEFSNSAVCVDGLENEDVCVGLDMCIQAILFLFYDPNLEDPLSSAFGSDMTIFEYVENVMISLKGGIIYEGDHPHKFEPNYGWIENYGQPMDLYAENVQSLNTDTNDAREIKKEITEYESTDMNGRNNRADLDSDNVDSGPGHSLQLNQNEALCDNERQIQDHCTENVQPLEEKSDVVDVNNDIKCSDIKNSNAEISTTITGDIDTGTNLAFGQIQTNALEPIDGTKSETAGLKPNDHGHENHTPAFNKQDEGILAHGCRAGQNQLQTNAFEASKATKCETANEDETFAFNNQNVDITAGEVHTLLNFDETLTDDEEQNRNKVVNEMEDGRPTMQRQLSKKEEHLFSEKEGHMSVY